MTLTTRRAGSVYPAERHIPEQHTVPDPWMYRSAVTCSVEPIRKPLRRCLMKIPLNPEADREARQRAWRQKVVAELEARRSLRLKRLTTDEPALRRAVDAYRAIDDGDVPQIALRQEFIRL